MRFLFMQLDKTNPWRGNTGPSLPTCPMPSWPATDTTRYPTPPASAQASPLPSRVPTPGMSRLRSPSKAQAKQSLHVHPSGPTPSGRPHRQVPPQHPGRRLCLLGAALHPRPCPGPALCPTSSAAAGAALLRTGLHQPEAPGHQGACRARAQALHVPSGSHPAPKPGHTSTPCVLCTTPGPFHLLAPHLLGCIWMQLRGLADPCVQQGRFLPCSANLSLGAENQLPRHHDQPTAGPCHPRALSGTACTEGACCPRPR